MTNPARFIGLIGTVLAGVAVIATAGTASADQSDDTYLHTLQQHGLAWPPGSDQMMINAGHAVCQDWVAGDTMAQTLSDVKKATGLSNNGSGTIIGAATANYCPEFRSQIP
jgi:Protein of unknown function (DUF732)